MTFKVGQWVVVDTAVSYWPVNHKNNKGAFQIKGVDQGSIGKYATFLGAPNNVYFKDLSLYKPQIGDKVKILSVMCGMQPGSSYDYTGQIGTVTELLAQLREHPSICIDGWYYKDEEGETYELVEPKGSINTTAPETPSTPVVKPTKRVLNGNV